mmetsp:Transcript_70678/g.114827  ORF Transcript_70678/g.114827 Transcript_70678/m.114827 type:complete len:246 (-) Transcript_70678:908-1645(-)
MLQLIQPAITQNIWTRQNARIAHFTTLNLVFPPLQIALSQHSHAVGLQNVRGDAIIFARVLGRFGPLPYICRTNRLHFASFQYAKHLLALRLPSRISWLGDAEGENNFLCRARNELSQARHLSLIEKRIHFLVKCLHVPVVKLFLNCIFLLLQLLSRDPLGIERKTRFHRLGHFTYHDACMLHAEYHRAQQPVSRRNTSRRLPEKPGVFKEFHRHFVHFVHTCKHFEQSLRRRMWPSNDVAEGRG